MQTFALLWTVQPEHPPKIGKARIVASIVDNQLPGWQAGVFESPINDASDAPIIVHKDVHVVHVVVNKNTAKNSREAGCPRQCLNISF